MFKHRLIFLAHFRPIEHGSWLMARGSWPKAHVSYLRAHGQGLGPSPGLGPWGPIQAPCLATSHEPLNHEPKIMWKNSNELSDELSNLFAISGLIIGQFKNWLTNAEKWFPILVRVD